MQRWDHHHYTPPSLVYLCVLGHYGSEQPLLLLLPDDLINIHARWPRTSKYCVYVYYTLHAWVSLSPPFLCLYLHLYRFFSERVQNETRHNTAHRNKQSNFFCLFLTAFFSWTATMINDLFIPVVVHLFICLYFYMRFENAGDSIRLPNFASRIEMTKQFVDHDIGEVDSWKLLDSLILDMAFTRPLLPPACHLCHQRQRWR